MRRILCLRFPPGASQRANRARRGPDSTSDREALTVLADWCRQFSPTVGVEDSPAPTCLLLDVTGLEHLYGDETLLARTVLQRCAARGLSARVAIADTLGAAWAVSLASRPLFTRVPPGRTQEALRPLPVSALRLTAEIVDLLHQLGVERIEQLERLPRADLAARFRPLLLQRWDQAIGQRDEPVPGQPLLPDLDARFALEYPTAQTEVLAAVVLELLGRVCARLMEHGMGALRVDCRLGMQDHAPLALSAGLFRPSAEPRYIQGLLQMQWERLSLAAPLTDVQITVAATAPLERRQQELFSDTPPQRHPRHLAVLLDRLSSRLGRGAVVGSRLAAEAQPELACVYSPWIDPQKRRRTHRGEAVAHDLPPRPLRLFCRPIPLSAVAVVPNGPPIQLVLRGQTRRVKWSWGPERIETGWWRRRWAERDYYRVETECGQRFWVYRQLSDGRWFWHGSFE